MSRAMTEPQPYAPPVLERDDGLRAPRLQPSPPFLLKYHPERNWTVMCGALIPMLARLPLEAGVANVSRILETGEFKLRHALAIQRDRGWIVIPHDIDGPGTSYIRLVAPGVYLSRWETAHAGSRVVTSDPEGYVSWLRGLVESGVLPKPHRFVLERMRKRLLDDLQAAQDRLHVQPSLQREVNRIKADLELVEAELQSHDRPVSGDPVDPFADSDLAGETRQ